MEKSKSKFILLGLFCALGLFITSCSVWEDPWLTPDSTNGGANTIVEQPAETKAKPDAVGDIVLSDGTAVAKENASKMSSAQKAAAVAVIFYTSGNRYLKNKIIGVGLNIGSELKWGLKGAEACSTFCKTYINEIKSGTDGYNNTYFIKENVTDYSEENYPALYFCTSYSAAGFTKDWYMPARYEMEELRENIESVSTAFTALGKTLPTWSHGWTSTHDSSDHDSVIQCNKVYIVWAAFSGSNNCDKYFDPLSAFPVHEFN
ncbi:MAG: hypothetical protein J5700_06770 [Treponema sp.]|nr:hypothetical protein [Treponema sp.]